MLCRMQSDMSSLLSSDIDDVPCAVGKITTVLIANENNKTL